MTDGVWAMKARRTPPGRTRVVVPLLGFGPGGCGAAEAERALRAVPGVFEAYVNPATESAYVTYNAAEQDPAALDEAIRSVGLRTTPPEAWRGLA